MRRTGIALFYIGFGSILSQILLIREFLVSFYGNELSIGIVFAGWLVWIGIGSVFGNRIIKRKQIISSLFSILLFVTPIITFMQILAVKFVRAFVHTATGEFLSIVNLLVFSFSILSAGCFLWGMLFTLGAKLLSSEKEELWLGVNKAYVLESLGSVIGGLLFSFLLASLLSTIQIVFLLFMIACGVVLLLKYFMTIKPIVLSLFGMTIAYIVLLQPIRKLEDQIERYQWSFINDNLSFVRSIDTKYQNLALLRLENQHTVYTDGKPAYNMPNTYDAEIFTHSIMVQCIDAKCVLVIGGGFNGVLKEILKYPVQEIEYVEIDQALLPFVDPVLDKQNQQALHDTRVKVISGDGREYLSRIERKFDVILLNISEPSTAGLNRFFTLEFYQQCASRLTTNGILAFSFPSSSEYIADELKDLNGSIYRTFKKIFANVLIIPGTRAILIGSKGELPLIFHPDSLAHRYKSAGISSEYFSEYMYEDLMLPERIKYITSTLESIPACRINTDSNPVTYYFDLLLWNRFLQGDNMFLSFITSSRIFIAGSAGIGLILLLFLLRRKQQEKRERTALIIMIACSGMTGMALNLLLLLNFQEAFGSVYEMVGAMTAAQMLGLALGALNAAWLSKKYAPKTLLFVVLLILTLVVFLMPELLDFLLFAHAIPFTLFTSMIAGCLIGMLFSFINQFYLIRSKNAGSIYAFDVFGSSIGTLTTSSILLPVLGIQETSYFLLLTLIPAVAGVLFIKRA